MKKLLLAAIIICASWASEAQIANGSTAPDFTVTDVNGNVHVLFDYIAQGKTVLIDVSATWCSPCWSFHHSGTFEKLYNTYGQGGSGEIVVLFVEGDSNTSLDCLYGISEENLTWGNWVEHSSFPIINSSELAELYEVHYFPTFFRICPDGKVNEIQQPSNGIPGLDVAFFRDNISENCLVLNGLQNHATPQIEDMKVCEGGVVTLKVTLTNYGMQDISNATVELLHETNVIATADFTGYIPFLGEATVNFEDVVLAPDQDYEAVITSINNVSPLNTVATRSSFNVIETTEGYNNITIKVYTNYYADEISWAIKNSAGSYVASGGPYLESDKNSIKTHNVILPGTATECYSVEFYSSSGYGWAFGDTEHGIDIESAGETIFSQRVENFGFVLKAPAAFKTNGTLDGHKFNLNEFSVFPNPSTGIINFSTKDELTVSVIDMTGKTVFKAESITDGASINLSSLQKGMYIIRAESENAQRMEKIIIE